MFKSIFIAGALALLTFASSTLPAFAAAGTATNAVVVAVKPAVLSQAEAKALQYMREEEKLAHDVYVTLYGEWGLRVFSNIAASEQQHTDAVATLLARYGVSDPTTGKAAGEFTDPTLQGLYDELIAQGSVSAIDALRVGALIEEVDILDLQERMAATENADILRVFANLLKGSQNHLRAFAATWENQTGETYAPQQLDQAEYERIAGAASRSGSANRGSGRSGRNGGRP